MGEREVVSLTLRVREYVHALRAGRRLRARVLCLFDRVGREERRGDGEGVLGLPWSGWKAGMRSVRHWSVLRLNANCVCWRERGVMRVCAHDAHLVGGVCERVAVGRRAAQLQRVVKNLFN